MSLQTFIISVDCIFIFIFFKEGRVQRLSVTFKFIGIFIGSTVS